MKRSAPLRRRRRVLPRERMRPEPCAEVYLRQGGKCICGCGRLIAPFPIGYHHVFPKARWPQFVNDPRAIVGCTAECHANHESGFTRLPRAPLEHARRLTEQQPEPERERMRAYLQNTYSSPQRPDSPPARA